MRNRTYDTYASPRWAFWRWRAIFGRDQQCILERLYVFDTPLGGLRLHFLHSEDPDEELRDHPSSFVSFVLRGKYAEELPSRIVWRRWFNFKTADTPHRIIDADPGTVTLVITGPRFKAWGFIREGEWIPWRQFIDER